jgi:branched-chain amino acid aminotransferase
VTGTQGGVFWVNGALVTPADATVSVLDHGLTVGDGVFETVLVRDGVPFALSRHLARLASSAAGLGLADLDVDHVRAAALEVVGAASAPEAARARLRITVTSGTGPVGSARGEGAPTLVVTLTAASSWPPSTRIATVPWVRNERSAVAGVKTTSYAENAVALAHAQRRGASEAVLANTRGDLCEGTGSNVFVVVEGVVLTPSLSSGCLAGITRQLVLEWGAEVALMHETDMPYDVLAHADEVFLTSSTRDVHPVTGVDDRELPVGPVTAAVAEAFAARATGVAAIHDP